MAIDPARILRRTLEAEQSGRRTLDATQASAVVRMLAVVIEEEPQGERHSAAGALVQAS